MKRGGRCAHGALALTFVAGCASKRQADEEFVGLGRVDASTEPSPGLRRPLGQGDLDQLQVRGQLLHAMWRTLALARTHVTENVGAGAGDVVLGLVSIDPAVTSGEVLFLRWPADVHPDPANLELADAQRWLTVSVVFDPDRVVDTQVLAGRLTPKTDPWSSAHALIAAKRAIHQSHPGLALAGFTVFEERETGNTKRPIEVVTRVYMLASDAAGPDFEVVVGVPHRKRPAEVERVAIVHAKPLTAGPITLALDQPAPATVARVLQREPASGEVAVRTATGGYHIDAATGRVTRDGAASGR